MKNNEQHLTCCEESKVLKMTTADCKRCSYIKECNEYNARNWCVIDKIWICDFHCKEFCWKEVI